MTTTTSSSVTIRYVIPIADTTTYTTSPIQWLIKYPNNNTRFIVANNWVEADGVTPNNGTIVLPSPPTEGYIEKTFHLTDTFLSSGTAVDGIYKFTLFYGEENTSQITLGTTTVRKITNSTTITI